MEVRSSRPSPRSRQTLKQMLVESDSASPRAVLDAPFFDHNSTSSSGGGGDPYYAYADTMSIRSGFLDHRNHCRRHLARFHFSDLLDVHRANSIFSSTRSDSGGGGSDERFASKRSTIRRLLRRISSFPGGGAAAAGSDRTRRRSFRTTSLNRLMSRVTPLAAETKKLSNAKWKSFRYSEMAAATDGFHPDNLIGKGGYADVYKGRLPGGEVVAVKRLARGGKEEQGTSFLTELGILGHVYHPNTTPLLGYCVDDGLFLVFPFFPHGSLASMLHGSQLMEWPARFKVAIGTARGLHYLHSSCRRRIIHRDIKASNILLGADFEPQITDFGLAKWLPSEWTHHTVPVEGTFGYLAPEYFFYGIVDEKTDVFAFGVLLLELVTGLRPIDNTQKSLVMKVRPLLGSANIPQLVDPRLKDAYDIKQVQRTMLAARLCIRYSAMARPSMEEVVRLLVEERHDIDLSATSLIDKLDTDEDLGLSFHGKDMSKYRALAFDSCGSPA